MNTYDFILLAINAMGDEVRGKTLLQKRLYFIGLLSEHLPELGYIAHYYGPYSEELSDTVGELRSAGFIVESSINYGAVNGSGFEVARRDYKLTTDGQEIADMLKKQNHALAREIKVAWERIEKAGNPDYMPLSIAAKVYHILQNGNVPLGKDEIAKMARNLGWEIDESDITKAEEFLLKLELIELVPAEVIT
ncbi:MAG: hypothetical protein ACYC64_00050 [Armatimonadota bacterium]